MGWFGYICVIVYFTKTSFRKAFIIKLARADESVVCFDFRCRIAIVTDLLNQYNTYFVVYFQLAFVLFDKSINLSSSSYDFTAI